jgi:hypothetical protein
MRHLIHIGFPKAGSTSLQQWFSEHSGFRSTPHALGGYANAVVFARQEAAEDGERPILVTSSEALVIPGVSRNIDAELSHPPRIRERRARVCRALRDLFTESHILVVTRGFDGALRSNYSEYVRKGGTWRATDFWHRRLPVLIDLLDYDATIDLYSKAFGRDRVIVLPFELLRDDPSGFGLEPSGTAPARANPGLSPAELHWYPRITRWVPRAARPLGRVGGRLEQMYRDRIDGPGLLPVVRRLDRVLPIDASEAPAPGEIVERFRGRASSLATLPHFEPYADVYLNDDDSGPRAFA